MSGVALITPRLLGKSDIQKDLTFFLSFVVVFSLLSFSVARERKEKRKKEKKKKI